MILESYLFIHDKTNPAKNPAKYHLTQALIIIKSKYQDIIYCQYYKTANETHTQKYACSNYLFK